MRKFSIQAVNRLSKGNVYCGPAAVSAITGCSTDDAVAIIKQRWPKRVIRGTYGYEVLHALRHLGYAGHPADRLRIAPRETLLAWAKRTHAARGSDRVFLVSAGNHWRVVQGWQCVCGITEKITTIGAAHKPRSRVRGVHEITRTADAAKPVPKKARKRDRFAAARKRCKALMEKWGIEFDVERERYCGDVKTTYWLNPPTTLPDEVHCNGEHYAHDWDYAEQLLTDWIGGWEALGLTHEDA